MVAYRYLAKKRSRLNKKIVTLYNKNYHRYHYMKKLKKAIADDSVEFILAQSGEELIGCGALKKLDSRSLSLTYLLVDKCYREKGIGKKIDQMRFGYYLENGNYSRVYASCVTDNIASQILKSKMRMRPICFRYCYRYNTKNRKFGHSILYLHAKRYFPAQPYSLMKIRNDHLRNFLTSVFETYGMKKIKFMDQPVTPLREREHSRIFKMEKLFIRRVFITFNEGYRYDPHNFLKDLSRLNRPRFIMIVKIAAMNAFFEEMMLSLWELGFFFSGLDFICDESENRLFLTLQYVPQKYMEQVNQNEIYLNDDSKKIKRLVDESRKLIF